MIFDRENKICYAAISVRTNKQLFLKFCKYFSYVVVAGLLAVASCSFGVDGTGSKSDPELYEEYKQNMIEMGEKYKK